MSATGSHPHKAKSRQSWSSHNRPVNGNCDISSVSSTSTITSSHMLQNCYSRCMPYSIPSLNLRLTWNEEAFIVTKEASANATLLYYPKPDAPTCLFTDASNTAVGAVLQQYVDNTWHPISFSKKMKPAETCYSTFDCELLAVSPFDTFGIFLKVANFTYRPQAPHFCPTGSSRPPLSPPSLTVGFYFSICINYPTHPWVRGCGYRCPLMY